MRPGGAGTGWLVAEDGTSIDDLPEDLAGLVKPEVQPGERLFWVSRAHRTERVVRGGHWAAGAWAGSTGSNR